MVRKTQERLSQSRKRLLAIRKEVEAGFQKQDFEYRVFVPISELGKEDTVPVSQVVTIEDEKGNPIEAIDFVQATWNRHKNTLPQNWSTSERWRQHEEEARRRAWQIVNNAFPETKQLSNRSLPPLWVHFPKPRRLKSEVKRVEVKEEEM